VPLDLVRTRFTRQVLRQQYMFILNIVLVDMRRQARIRFSLIIERHPDIQVLVIIYLRTRGKLSNTFCLLASRFVTSVKPNDASPTRSIEASASLMRQQHRCCILRALLPTSRLSHSRCRSLSLLSSPTPCHPRRRDGNTHTHTHAYAYTRARGFKRIKALVPHPACTRGYILTARRDAARERRIPPRRAQPRLFVIIRYPTLARNLDFRLFAEVDKWDVS